MKIFQKFSRRWLLAILVCGSIATALGGHTGLGQAVSSRLRGLAGIVLAPFTKVGTYPVTQMRKQLHAGDNRLAEENRRLREQLTQVQSMLYQRLRQDAAVAGLYSDIYHRFPDFNCELIPATVLAYPSLPYSQTLVISGPGQAMPAGTNVTTRELLTDRSKALPPGLATISTGVVVGRIVESGAFMSRLRLVTDSAFQMAAYIHRQLSPGKVRKFTDLVEHGAAFKDLNDFNNLPIKVLAQGDGARGMKVTTSKGHGILAGDLLVTMSDDRFLPEGVLIGYVEDVRDDPKEPGQVILAIRPEADLSALSDVYIVVPPSIKQSPGKDAPN
jgi:cell shape-determining protein MreC